MATKRQLVEWHTQNCQHGLLPPFPNQQITTEKRAIEEEQNGLNARTVAALAARIYRLCWEEDFHPADYDGLGLHSVEYWSGGQQLFGPLGCNLRRIIALEPQPFSRHLVNHTILPTTKQRQPSVPHRFSSRNILEFWGQPP